MTAIKIAAIGDSITYGYPYAPEDSWLHLAAARLNVEAINKGINGDTTDGMLSRFRGDISSCAPSHVIIMGGTNDVYEGVPVSRIVGNICEMVNLAQQVGIEPVIGLPIPCDDLAEEELLGKYREAVRKYAEENSIELIDFYQVMAGGSGFIKEGLQCDGQHPNQEGYKVMAEAAYKFLLKAIIDARVHSYYWEEELSCAITALKILSEVFSTEIHAQLFSATFALNAGRLCSQCGLVEGALLFIGIYAEQKGLAAGNIADLCRIFARDFQIEFGSVLCKELRPEGFSPDNPPHLCENLTKRAVLFAAEFLAEKI